MVAPNPDLMNSHCNDFETGLLIQMYTYAVMSYQLISIWTGVSQLLVFFSFLKLLIEGDFKGGKISEWK
jgi:hypothetical protein